MKTFSCGVCHKPVYFENTVCTHCGALLGFLPDQMRLAALIQGDDALWREPKAAPTLAARVNVHAAPRQPSQAYRQCENYARHDVCNWMVPADSPDRLCLACRPNQVIPSLSRAGNLDKWFRIERGKRRLFYGLLRLGLPIRSKTEDPMGGLGFAFLSSRELSADQVAVTGHDGGLITINIDEADSSIRERRRLDLDEKYRTLLGHFRHEVGHYYWDLLIRDGGRLDPFRALFGDERADYGQALQSHYANGGPTHWQDGHISAYAAAHPWEDWAETWAHYLHIVDTLDTGEHFGITVERRMPDGSVQHADPNFDPYRIADFGPIIDNWLPLPLR